MEHRQFMQLRREVQTIPQLFHGSLTIFEPIFEPVILSKLNSRQPL